MKAMTKTEAALKLVEQIGVVRPKDLAGHGIAPVYLRRLLDQGRLVQSARGVYRLPNRKPSVHHDLATVSKLIPNGIICLISALNFHGLLPEAPDLVWVAVDRKARRPTIEGLPLRVVRFPDVSLKTGLDRHVIEGVSVPITNPVKTVVDCVKYRSKIGLDVALDALRECLRRRKCPVDDILKYAKVCRVESVIRRYLEALA
ncbi:MAG: type IV toxin-antitoxin system AbiEi family antitoxin domain-containing protein [Verrucomicrobiae bacterium]|nr:type IV toxin-antitoxin system AbiEi family antitoxin domain-containing protein [Verrucomicrobiae bacterium]